MQLELLYSAGNNEAMTGRTPMIPACGCPRTTVPKSFPVVSQSIFGRALIGWN